MKVVLVVLGGLWEYGGSWAGSELLACLCFEFGGGEVLW